MNNKLKELIQPYWVESQQGVYIPLIDKVLLKDNVPIMPYNNYMGYAKTNGVKITTKDELLQMYLQRNQINKILREHNGDILDTWFGSSSEYNPYNESVINFSTGNCSHAYKSNPVVSRAVVDLKSKTNNKTMEQFNSVEYLKNPNRKVVTRDGKDVRIICTDKKEAVRPLIALITKDDGTEYLQTYLLDGRISETINYIDDLFFDTEKHEGWINLAIDSSGEIFVATNHPHKDEKTAKLAVSDKSNVVATIKIEWEEE